MPAPTASAPRPPARRFFTVDVEDWTADFPDLTGRPSRLERPLRALLELLAEHKTRATLFFLVEAARRNAGLVREAIAAGHVVGLHGLEHRLIYEQAPAAFAAALRDGRRLLEDVAGCAVASYRAPYWSITPKSLWAIDAIAAAGFEVDSSIFPTKNHLYGIPEAPLDPYELAAGLLEIPPSVAQVAGRKVPFGGGFYLRALPLPATRWMARRRLDEGRHVLLYVHPWELDPDQPRDLPYASRMAKAIHYWDLSSTAPRLAALLREFGPFEPLPRTRAAGADLIPPGQTPRTLELVGGQCVVRAQAA